MLASQHDRRPPDRREPCPACGPDRQSAANRVRAVLGIWRDHDGRETWFCNRCGDRGVVDRARPNPNETTVTKPKSDRGEIAKYLWSKSLPATGTPVETYLSNARELQVLVPPTLRYLPARADHPHAMLAACGLVEEVEPGQLQTVSKVPAVHLTRLSADGEARLDKRMLGPVSGHPIVLAPPNDGLGLVIAEGIEDSLTMHQVTGLGAWAGGSAGHMAKLGPVVPDYVECVTLIDDGDPAGMQACDRLECDLLARGFEVWRIRAPEVCHGT